MPGVNDPLNWSVDRTLPAAEGDNSDTDLNSGPNGLYLTYRYFVPNDNRVGLRRFDPATNTFGAATYVEGPDGIDNNSLDYPDSFQDPTGRIHVVWRSLYDGQRLRYTVSDGSATSFTPVANLARQESFFDPALAAGADGKGFAVWTNGTAGSVRIVPLDPQPEPVTPPPPGGGGTTTPPPGGGGTTGPTATPTFSFSGPGNSATAIIIGDRVRVRMRGTIRPPAGVSTAAACKGKVKLIVKRKRKTLAKTRAALKLKSGKCRFGKTIFIARRKAASWNQAAAEGPVPGQRGAQGRPDDQDAGRQELGAAEAHGGRYGAPYRPPRGRYPLVRTRTRRATHGRHDPHDAGSPAHPGADRARGAAAQRAHGRLG